MDAAGAAAENWRGRLTTDCTAPVLSIPRTADVAVRGPLMPRGLRRGRHGIRAGKRIRCCSACSAEGLEVVCLDEFECVLQFLWIRVAAEAELKRGGDLVGGLWPEFPLQALGEQF